MRASVAQPLQTNLLPIKNLQRTAVSSSKSFNYRA